MPSLLPIFRESATQWIAFLCACGYIVFFSCLTQRPDRARFWRLSNPDLWLLLFLGFGGALYAFDYPIASETTHALVLVTAVAIGKGLRFLALFRREASAVQRLLACIAGVFIVLLTIAAAWPTPTTGVSRYREQVRWSGPWDNPNIYGILMGVGLILVLGVLMTLSRRDEKQRPTQRASEVSVAHSSVRGWVSLRGLLVLVLVAIAGLMALGLLRSYSRGAWLAFAGALVYLAFSLKARRDAPPHAFLRWLGSNALSVTIIGASCVVLAFWQFRDTEFAPVRRVFSIANPNDFSWRNRVAAYEGTLQMMAERPLGFGWNKPERVYDHYYRDTKVPLPMAIQMNDYLMLGTTLGILPLLGLATYLVLVLFPHRPSSMSGSLSAVCRSAAIVLAIGFWFDGGLFKMATATPFWILLELGRSDQHYEGD